YASCSPQRPGAASRARREALPQLLRRLYSLTLMLAALMTGPHLSISSLRWVASAAGVEPIITTPSASSLVWTAGSAITATVSAWILRTISGGVLAGTKNANQDEVS